MVQQLADCSPIGMHVLKTVGKCWFYSGETNPRIEVQKNSVYPEACYPDLQ